MQIKSSAVALSFIALSSAALLTAGCKKTADNKPNFTRAINQYYASRPACLFPSPQQFPAQADTKDDSKTAPFAALVDQGLLTRTTQEKKEFLVLSKSVTNYDLSAKGRSAWTADQQNPGFGNFCYGTRTVTSIDDFTPTNDQPGATTTVSYHAGIGGAPVWAQAPETQNAYPQLAADLANSAGTAVLTNTTAGWSVTQGPAGAARGVSNADGNIVR